MSSKFLNNAVNPIAISDVIGLQDELDEIQDEIAGGGGNKTVETFTQQIASTPAGFGEYKLYAKSDGFYERGTGAEVKLAGGGGGGIEYIGSSAVVNEGLVFASGLSRDLVQNKTGYSLDSFNNKLVVPDIKTDEHSSINTTLTNISYNDTDPLKPFTRIGGELDVDKIKNSSHTAELEFETSGKLLLKCDNDIYMKASIFEFKDSYDTSSQTRGVLINLDENLGNYEISCPDWFMNLSNVYRIYGIETPNPDYIELDLAGIKLKTNNNNRISIESDNGVNIRGETGIEIFSNLNNITNVTDLNIDFLDTSLQTGLTINPVNTQIDFKSFNNLWGRISLINVNDLFINATSSSLELQGNNNVTLTAATGDINLTANGNVTTTNTPSTDNCIVNKSYLEANTQPKPAVYYLGATTDYNPATAPIHTINHIEAGVATFLNIGWNGSASGGLLQVRLSANYPASYATISTAEGTATVTNKYKYLPLNPTTANSYTINSNYIDDGSIATCMISPIQTAQTPPIAPTRPVIKITIHNLENADSFGSNVGYVMIIEQY